MGGGLLKRHFREGLSAGDRGEGTHIKHAAHACDLGRVEAERLVERRVLCRVERRACDARRGAAREA